MKTAVQIRILKTDETPLWMSVLQRCRQHDFHHLPQYHRVAERRGEEEGMLFSFEQDGYTIALPLLLRPVDPANPSGWRDATSVYGYGGPVSSHELLPRELVGRFQAALAEVLKEHRVISVFSRLHPLISQAHLLENLGECVANGTTISIDLTLSESEQRAQYNKSCRTSIRKLTDVGFVGLHDSEKRYLPEFVEVYRETMRRAGALSSYFFDEDYFNLLTNELGEASHLFVVLKDGQVAAATICTICDGIVQDHLGGTRDAFLKFSPDRLVVHTERLWAKEIGARVFHLGGGVGSQEDSLFRYKSGFSDRRHTFSTWRWVIEPHVYAQVAAEKARTDDAQGLRPVSANYFPSYRCPSVPRDAHRAEVRAASPAMRILPPEEADEWLRIVRGSRQHDFYFLPGYQAMAARREGGEARLFVYEQDGHTLALPLVLRPIAPAEPENSWCDATSVYGYAGPLVSHECVPEAVVSGFQYALAAALRQLRVVSVFSRLHPLLAQRHLLAGLGECRPQGETVAIDLTASLDVQRAKYRDTLRTRVNRLRRTGVNGMRDPHKDHLREFIAIYRETMHRVGAGPAYFFEDDYFAALAAALGDTLQLFVVTTPGGQVISAGLFTLCGGIMQYHLGGTRTDALNLSPMALLLDTARLWANEQQARAFHLGGGVGASADSLFKFKAAFSPGRHEFATWRWILDPETYASLCDERLRDLAAQGLEFGSPHFFPAYRAPGRPAIVEETDPPVAEALLTHG